MSWCIILMSFAISTAAGKDLRCDKINPAANTNTGICENSNMGTQERTFMIFSLAAMFLRTVKTILRPIRKLYLAIEPEIFLGKCMFFTFRPEGSSRATGHEYDEPVFSHNYGIENAYSENLGEFDVARSIFSGDLLSSYSQYLGFNIGDTFDRTCFIDYCRERILKWLDN